MMIIIIVMFRILSSHPFSFCSISPTESWIVILFTWKRVWWNWESEHSRRNHHRAIIVTIAVVIDQILTILKYIFNIYSHPKVYRNPLGCRSFCDAPSFFLRSIIIIIIQNHHIHNHHHRHNHHHHPTLWWPCRSLHSFSRLAFANTGSIGRCSPEKEITMILTSGTSRRGLQKCLIKC